MAQPDGTLNVKLTLDTSEALDRIRELSAAAQPVTELLEVKRDWAPYILAVGGWAFALAALLVR